MFLQLSFYRCKSLFMFVTRPIAPRQRPRLKHDGLRCLIFRVFDEPALPTGRFRSETIFNLVPHERQRFQYVMKSLCVHNFTVFA